MEGKWTNGDYIFLGGMVNDTALQYGGGNAHEGGYDFFAIRRADGKFYIAGKDSTRDDASLKPGLGDVGDQITFKNIAGLSVMIIRGKNGKLHDVLQRIPEDIGLSDLQAADQSRYGLSGSYVDKASGQKITFTPDAQNVLGSTMGTHYQFETHYDFLTSIFTFDNKKSFEYVKTPDGIDIYTTHQTSEDDDDSWVRGKRVLSLRKTEWFNLSGDASLPGRYSFASTCLLTSDILQHFSAAERRLIRNEIFARYGYRFKSEDLKAYFSAQPWYKPVSDDVSDRLTELERLNVEVLGPEGK